MSIINRLGWANRSLLNEGRLHTDELKQRISNLFRRTSLGNSPTYVVGKISEIIRREKGDDTDINEIADEDIIRIANSEEVTNGKFAPELKGGIEDARQESGDQISDLSAGLPSQESEGEEFEMSGEAQASDDSGDTDEMDFEMSVPEQAEDAEAVKKTSKCDCDNNQRIGGQHITKESVKLTAKQVDKQLKENYIKSRQHKFLIEERYRSY
jgi:hypothetical protein